MNLEHATSPLDDDRDVVIFPRGADWGFRLPEQHTISISEERNVVYLAIPDHGSGYGLERTEETDGEVRVYLGFPTSDAHAIGTGHVPPLRAYSFPQIQDELERLKRDLVNLGGSLREADAWAQGASYDSHTERLRARIRTLRQGA